MGEEKKKRRKIITLPEIVEEEPVEAEKKVEEEEKKPLLRELERQIWKRIDKNADRLTFLAAGGKEQYITDRRNEVKEIFKEELENWEETKEDFKRVIREVREIGGVLMNILGLDDKSNFIKALGEKVKEYGKGKGLKLDKTAGKLIDGEYDI